MSRNLGTSHDWDRTVYAARTDAPLCATAVIAHSVVALITPPAPSSADAMHALLAKAKDRIERPYLAPGQRRKK